ncbi:MAG: helix-turn-helix domain-containing protein [Kiritimatiellae bacterium]|nr:helix-turn-helix domain-containing protein [Kiritimatiellia bacterium]MDD5523085.1 helix-turn-helix domain-containing protein [Kiritimatiellia bacterium]
MKGEKVVSLAGWRDKLLLSFDEVAILLDVSSRTVRRLIASGELPEPVKVRKASRIRVQDVNTYLDRITRERHGIIGGAQ